MFKYFIGLFFISLFFISCKKEKENFTSESISDYYPLEVGKYITYNLDSTVFVNFGQKDTVIHYEAQDRVDAQITDNLGRPAYRIIRYIRQDSLQDWIPNNTFSVIPTQNSIEYIENNFRYLKLELPVKQDFSWKGNSYLPSMAYAPAYDFASDFTDGWDYIYDSIDVPLTINSLTFDSTIKVFEQDYFTGDDPPLPTTSYSEKTYAVEKYAKGVGLIYREYLHWEYQGVNKSYKGFGIKLSIIDHN